MQEVGTWIALVGGVLFFIGIQVQIGDIKSTKLNSPDEGLEYVNLVFKDSYNTDDYGNKLPNTLRLLASRDKRYGNNLYPLTNKSDTINYERKSNHS